MADHVQPDWLCKLPFDVLNHIAQLTRNALTGHTTFRSVCRTWRAAVAPAPRLLPPSPHNATALVFPLSSGWSIVVDPRDISCHLSHLATGATAALPKLNDLGDGSDTSKIRLLLYETDSDSDPDLPFRRLAAPLHVEAVADPDDQCTDQDASSSDEGSTCEDQDEYAFNEDGGFQDYSDDNASSLDKATACEDENEYSSDEEYLGDIEFPSFSFRGDALRKYLDKRLTDQEMHKDTQHKILTYSHDGRELYNTYIQFSNHFRFAIHVPPSTPAGSTEGVVIMMYHRWLQARSSATGMVFCRPGDASWTMISNPNPKGRGFVDFAYFDGKIFAMNKRCVTLVFDPTTLDLLYQVDVPPGTSNFSSKMSCSVAYPIWTGKSRIKQCLHVVALPQKLLLVKVFMPIEWKNSYTPVDFHVFELSPNDLAWCKVSREGIRGNYELFMDSYHATFSDSGDGSGTRIYHADNELFGSPSCVWGYCYNMQDDMLELIHEPPKDDQNEYSTKPSWFVP